MGLAGLAEGTTRPSPRPRPRPESETEAEPESETEAESEAETETETESEAESETKAEAESMLSSERGPEVSPTYAEPPADRREASRRGDPSGTWPRRGEVW
jgi:hypothetical protein